MGSNIWLMMVICCGGVSGLQRWLKLVDEDCQGCNQLYDDSVLFTSQLFVSSNKIIIGGRNTVYSINMFSDDMMSYDDSSNMLDNSVERCRSEGRGQSDCQNYYKVLLMLSESEIMICGTWGYAPKCDVRTVNSLDFNSRAHVRNGDGFCPADHSVPITYLKLEGGIGFAGTCTDVCTHDSITRFNLLPGSLSGTSRTFKTNDILSDPKFVYSFENGDYAYFLFRETAVEVATEKIYSRVGRICKNDVGSSSPFSNHHFLSYFKARIFCTSDEAGQMPFDHNEVDTAVFSEGVLYAAFSGPKNLQTGSIVCSFTIKSIDEAFEGPYLKFDVDGRKWSKSPSENYNCMNKKEDKIAYELSLMADSLQNLQPLFNTQSYERLTSMTADTFRYNDNNIIVLYAGSGKGVVHRVAFIKDMESTVYHASYSVGDSEVTSLLYGDGHVYAMGANWLTIVPIKQECGATNCGSCVAAHFPYCGWCYDVNVGRWSCSTKDKCTLRNWVAPTDTCTPLPSFRDTPKNLTLQEGHTAQFKCTARDSLDAVVWTKDGGQLPRIAGFINPGNIYIPEVDTADTGYYECSLNNTSGVVTKRAYLHVQVPARFEPNGEPVNVSVSPGHQDLVLRCRAEGVPTATVYWKRTNGNMPDGSQQLNNGDLKIIRVMKEDEGGYQCFVNNNIGPLRDSRIAYLTVLDKSQTIPSSETTYNPTPISITVLTIGIVISAVVCFVIGLTVHMIYRRRKQKREYIDNHNDEGAYSQFSTYPHQDDAGYLCPNWNGTWQSYHHDSTQRAMFNSLDDEAPPAYSPTQSNMTSMLPKDWCRTDIMSDNTDCRTGGGDYAEIMTLPIPPPISPPILPLLAPLSSPPPLSTNRSAVPRSRDHMLTNHSPAGTSSAYSHTNRNPSPPILHCTNGDYSNKLNVSSAI